MKPFFLNNNNNNNWQNKKLYLENKNDKRNIIENIKKHKHKQKLKLTNQLYNSKNLVEEERRQERPWKKHKLQKNIKQKQPLKRFKKQKLINLLNTIEEKKKKEKHKFNQMNTTK